MNILYKDIFDRNIGLLSDSEQEKLKNSSVAVFGVGGLGGIISEVLVRSGVGHLKIIDKDRFETSNLNRQNFAFTDTIGQLKVDVTDRFLKKINPDLMTEKYLKVDKSNIMAILNNTDVVFLALDDVIPILLISRNARKRNIPVVEGWALPYGNVRVFTGENQPLEEVYHLEIPDGEVDNLSTEVRRVLNQNMLFELKKIKDISAYFPKDAMERIEKGKITSFAPMVWFTAVLMSIEGVKIMLGWGTVPTSSDFTLYDPFTHTIP